MSCSLRRRSPPRISPAETNRRLDLRPLKSHPLHSPVMDPGFPSQKGCGSSVVTCRPSLSEMDSRSSSASAVSGRPVSFNSRVVSSSSRMFICPPFEEDVTFQSIPLRLPEDTNEEVSCNLAHTDLPNQCSSMGFDTAVLWDQRPLSDVVKSHRNAPIVSNLKSSGQGAAVKPICSRPCHRHRRSSFFGSFSTAAFRVLLGALLFAQPAQAADFCNVLASLDKDNLRTCTGNLLYLQLNGTYPVMNFSTYNQTEITEVLSIVQDSGGGVDQGATKQVIGNILIEGSDIESIYIDYGYENNVSQTLTLENNPNLKNVTITPDIFPNYQDYRVFLRVKGNRVLKEEIIQALRNTTLVDENSIIQDYGECFGTDIASFKDLEGCHYIYGDLTFSQEATNDLPNFPSTLTEVRGCIVIQNTSLTNVDFVKGIKTNCPSKNVVRDNRNLCIYSQKARKLEIEMKHFLFEDNKDCEDVCTWSWALANRRNPFVQCAVIQGDVNINGSQFGKEYEMLYTVKMIMGQLTIHGNSFENFTIFKKLLKVDSQDSTKPAIHIFDNPNMKLLELPVLREITRPPSDVPLLVVEDNHEDLMFSKRQHTRLSKLGKIEIPVGEPVTTTVATTTRVHPTTSSSSHLSFVWHASLWSLIYILLR